MCLKCPPSTLHDDIERRTSSRAHQSRAQFLTAALPFTKEKQQKPRCLEFLLQRYALLSKQSIVHKCTIKRQSEDSF